MAWLSGQGGNLETAEGNGGYGDAVAGIDDRAIRAAATGPATGLRSLATGVGAVAMIAMLGLDDGVVLCPYRRCTGRETSPARRW